MFREHGTQYKFSVDKLYFKILRIKQLTCYRQQQTSIYLLKLFTNCFKMYRI